MEKNINIDKEVIFYLKLNKKLTEFDYKHLSYNKAEIPEQGKTYTLKKCFFHVSYSFKKSKYVIHLNELEHGNLIGYDPKYFICVDKLGNNIAMSLPISKEENPSFIIQDGTIIAK